VKRGGHNPAPRAIDRGGHDPAPRAIDRGEPRGRQSRLILVPRLGLLISGNG